MPRDNGVRGRHFLDLDRIAPAELRRMLDWAAAYKRGRPPGGAGRGLLGSGDRGVLQQLRRALADLYRGARGSFPGIGATRMITHGNAKTA